MNYRVFVDLDGVLADFVGGFKAQFGAQFGAPPDAYEKPALKQLKQTFAERRFFETLPPFPGAQTFMQKLDALDLAPVILTSVSEFDSEENSRQKALWVKRHIGDYPFRGCQKSHEKAEFAAPHHILIDDREKSTQPFQAASGLAILHRDFDTTLNALHQLIKQG